MISAAAVDAAAVEADVIKSKKRPINNLVGRFHFFCITKTSNFYIYFYRVMIRSTKNDDTITVSIENAISLTGIYDNESNRTAVSAER